MPEARALPAATAARFDVRAVEFVVSTGIADVWKVRRSDGQMAALKLYKNASMGNEAAGALFLSALDGQAAALVLDETEDCLVTEWLDGPSLGDLVRDGQDAQAAAHLVEVANQIHAQGVAASDAYPRLESWFEALFAVQFAADCPAPAQVAMRRCQDIARSLLIAPQDVRPLHGDLHHDNIRLGARGYCAFDAKGVLGERAYELANAFRNPKGVPDLVRAPARIRFLADLWSDRFVVDRKRLMQWAAVKCALSISWRAAGELGADEEFDLLDRFLACAEA